MIKLKALGGAREVGRSSFLIDAGEKILLESGVKFSNSHVVYPLPLKENINAIVLSHAHLDHSGYIPALFKDSHAMLYLTQPTLELSKILWQDSIKIADAENLKPAFTKDDVKRAEKYSFPINYRRKMQITHHAMLEFFDAGHILGSAITKLEIKNRTIVYTGDYKIDETRLFNGADTKIGKTDYLIIESTYGDRNHPDRKKIEQEFVDTVEEAINQGGHALVPAFAVGRSQEIIDILFEHKVKAPIYFDGMGQKAARISLEFPEFLKNPKVLGSALHSVNWVKGKNRQKALKEPGIIVTSAGMMQGGPVVGYMEKIYKDKNSKILLTGYQVEHTAGRILLEKGLFPINGKNEKVSAEVKKFDFSAHASQRELLELISKLEPKKVICVHGDEEVMKIFMEEIKALGFESTAPKAGEEIILG